MMNTDFRYQLESKRLTGHQPQKLSCPTSCWVRLSHREPRPPNRLYCEAFQKFLRSLPEISGRLPNFFCDAAQSKMED